MSGSLAAADHLPQPEPEELPQCLLWMSLAAGFGKAFAPLSGFADAVSGFSEEEETERRRREAEVALKKKKNQ